MSRAVVACLVAVVVGLGTGCGGPLPGPPPRAPARARGARGQLPQGRTLVAAKCSSCHRTPQPAEHKTEEWPKMIDEMSRRAHVDSGERQAIRDDPAPLAPRRHC